MMECCVGGGGRGLGSTKPVGASAGAESELGLKEGTPGVCPLLLGEGEGAAGEGGARAAWEMCEGAPGDERWLPPHRCDQGSAEAPPAAAKHCTAALLCLGQGVRAEPWGKTFLCSKKTCDRCAPPSPALWGLFATA